MLANPHSLQGAVKFGDMALEAIMTDWKFFVQEHQKPASNEIASGMPLLVTAADRRARAVYYSFTLVCIGLAVLLVVILVESHRWRTTITNESAVSTFPLLYDF